MLTQDQNKMVVVKQQSDLSAMMAVTDKRSALPDSKVLYIQISSTSACSFIKKSLLDRKPLFNDKL